MSTTPTIIYIVSSGRSGSTFLELLLGAHKDIEAVGELNVLSYECEEGITKKCGCGSSIHTCGFWGPIIENHKTVLACNRGVAKFREGKTGWKIIRRGELPAVFEKRPPEPYDALREFGEDNEEIFNAIGETAEHARGHGIRYIVDASKDFYRLLWLKHAQNIRIKVIKIVKDPRAFVYTMAVKNDFGRWKRIALALRMSIRYIIENILMDRVCAQFDSRDTLRVRYEDLATHPKQEMQRITAWLGVPYSDALVDEFRNTIQHGVAGNEMRHKRTDIRLDEAWKEHAKTLPLKLARLITGRFARRYGYTL